jgi:hypothetical protein
MIFGCSTTEPAQPVCRAAALDSLAQRVVFIPYRMENPRIDQIE